MRYEFQNQYGIFDFTPEDEVYARLTEIIICIINANYHSISECIWY